MMTWIWFGMVALSLICGIITGNITQVTTAALEGAGTAVELCLSIAGMVCLWSGIMEVMRQSGLAQQLSFVLRPILCRIFPQVAQDTEVMEYISANVSANLLGLGNAATPMGICAIQKMQKDGNDTASDAMCMLVVCNTASIQLIPTTVATVRAAQGCATPFDILPAVWTASAIALCAGILICKMLCKIWRR